LLLILLAEEDKDDREDPKEESNPGSPKEESDRSQTIAVRPMNDGKGEISDGSDYEPSS
jgi:hypothetical protein